jgi:hypothetical protein
MKEHQKRVLLMDYARKFKCTTFVETGTYKGDTVKAMLVSGLFQQIHTIDIYLDRAQAARNRYASFPNIHCWHGDSAEQMPEILRYVETPTLFWLDAHHSGGQIARVKGLIETPLMKELEAILSHPLAAQHVILIDDARYFEAFGSKYENYPTEGEAAKLVLDKCPDWVWEVRDDIVRTHRRA